MDSRLAILVGALAVSACGKLSVVTPPPGGISNNGVWLFLSDDGTGHAVKAADIRSFSFTEDTYDYFLQGELSANPLCAGLVESEIRPIKLGSGAIATNVLRLDLGDDEWRPDQNVAFSLMPLQRLVPESRPDLALYESLGLKAADATCDSLVLLSEVDSSGIQRLIEIGEDTRSTTCAPGLMDVSLRDDKLRLLRPTGEGPVDVLCTSGPVSFNPLPGHLSDDGSPAYAISSAESEWFIIGCPDALPGAPRWLETNGDTIETVTRGGLVECRDQRVRVTNPMLRAASEEFVATDTEVFARQSNTFAYDPTDPLMTTTDCAECGVIFGMRRYLGGVAVLVSGINGQQVVGWTDAEGNATPFVPVKEAGRVMSHNGFLLAFGISGLQQSLHPGW